MGQEGPGQAPEVRGWITTGIAVLAFIGGLAALWYSTWSSRIGRDEFEKAIARIDLSIKQTDDLIESVRTTVARVRTDVEVEKAVANATSVPRPAMSGQRVTLRTPRSKVAKDKGPP